MPLDFRELRSIGYVEYRGAWYLVEVDHSWLTKIADVDEARHLVTDDRSWLTKIVDFDAIFRGSRKSQTSMGAG